MSEVVLQPAAVLILSFQENGEEQFLLTRRTDKVEHHKGQICFPGGAVDPTDESLWETALREAREEIGLDTSRVTFYKELPPQVTPTGFRVSPFWGKAEGSFVWVPSPHEIDEIIHAPIRHFKDPKNLRFEASEWQGRIWMNPHFSYGPHDIWGMTGRVICDALGIEIPK